MMHLGELLPHTDVDVLLRDGCVGDTRCGRSIAVENVHARNRADDLALTPPDDHVRSVIPAIPNTTAPPSYCLPVVASTMTMMTFVSSEFKQGSSPPYGRP